MKQVRAFLDLIKFEHTVFALPFAYLGMVLAAGGLPTFHQFFWITVAMASARTLGMSFNRLADRHIDARNPRTANRPIQTGKISVQTVVTGVVVSLLVLTFAAWELGPFTLTLLPGAIVCLLGYAYAKRFTWLSHFMLGFTDGLAPMGAWAAVRGSLFTVADLPAWLLLFTVTFWIAGFDLIYACQDTEFDRAGAAAQHSGQMGQSCGPQRGESVPCAHRGAAGIDRVSDESRPGVLDRRGGCRRVVDL